MFSAAYICIYLCRCAGSHALSVCVLVHMWKSGDSLWELLLSFYHVVPWDWTWDIRLGGRHLCPLSHLLAKIFNCYFILRFFFYSSLIHHILTPSQPFLLDLLSHENAETLNDVKTLVQQLYTTLCIEQHQLNKERELVERLEDLRQQLAPLEKVRLPQPPPALPFPAVRMGFCVSLWYNRDHSFKLVH